MGSRPIGAWLVGTLGGVLGGLFLLDLVWISTPVATSPDVFAATLAFGLAMPVALVGSGVWLARTGFAAERVWRVALWSLGGLAVLTALTGWRFYFRAVATGSAGDPVQTLLVNAQAGAVAGVLVGLYDARAARRADQRDDARQRLRFLNRLMRHDILNAVQVIDGYAERLATSGDDQAHVDTIHLKTEEIADLIRRVREIEKTTRKENFQPQEFGRIVAAAADATRSTYDDVTVEVNVEDDLLVDANDLLSVAVENLLDNAVEHNDGDPHVWVTASQHGDTVRLEVADDGPGIPDERRERVFDLGDRNGHGLGLYLVDTLVEQYGGTVHVEDRAKPRSTDESARADGDPRGAVFVVELPAAGET
ncbi:MAG: ATP-binding protein [Haloarculaceae archaeon]